MRYALGEADVWHAVASSSGQVLTLCNRAFIPKRIAPEGAEPPITSLCYGCRYELENKQLRPRAAKPGVQQ